MKTLRVFGIIAVLAALIALGLYNNVKSKEKSVIAPPVLTNIPVKVAVVKREQISQPVSLTGNVYPMSDVIVVSETQGRVVAINAKNGDYLQQGAVLVQVEDELIVSGLKLAQANYDKAKLDLERMEKLKTQNATTDNQYEQMRLGQVQAENALVTAKRRLNDTRIKMPISGQIANRMIDAGAYVAPGTPVANVIDIGTLKVRVNVPEEDAFKMSLGERAEITSSVYPGKTFYGNVYSISNKGDDAHTFPIEVVLPNNPSAPLKAGMFARVSFTSRAAHAGMVIPRDALVGSVKQAQVYVLDGDKARLRKVTVIGEVGNMLEISAGLNDGDKVVTSGQINLSDGSAVSLLDENTAKADAKPEVKK